MAVLITDTTLRDAHQSLIATRMRTRDMLPVAEELDAVGFFSLEVWGGATFDTCIRFLNEDPWERLKMLREKVKKTQLQMLLRGQNLVGYRHYPDDVVQEFIRLAVKNGIDVFRIFDALNDIRNMELSIRTAKKYRRPCSGDDLLYDQPGPLPSKVLPKWRSNWKNWAANRFALRIWPV